jgi:alpha-beta hydrolase superfamily lysophospholipase
MRQLASTDKHLVVLENSFHMITLDNDRHTVVAEIVRFLERFRPAQAPVAAAHSIQSLTAHVRHA